MEISSIGFDREFDTFAAPAVELEKSGPASFVCGNTDSTEGWTRFTTETTSTRATLDEDMDEDGFEFIDLSIERMFQTPVGEKITLAFNADSHRTCLRYLREALEMKEYLNPAAETILHLFCLGSLIELERYDEAIAEEMIVIPGLLKAKEEFPELLEGLEVGEMIFDRGVYNLYLGNREQGIQDLKESLKTGYLTAAFLLKLLGELPTATEESVPSTLTLDQQAEWLFIQGQYEKALAVSFFSETDDHYGLRSACYVMIGQYEKALAYYKAEEEIDFFGLVLVVAMQEGRDEARAVLETFIEDLESGPAILAAFALKTVL